MKKFSKLLGILLIAAMVVSMGVTGALASDYGTANEHTITISNTDANGAHTYEGYQVFKGNLNAAEGILSDIQWGTGVDGDGIVAALVAASEADSGVLKGKFTGLHVADNTDPENPVAASSAVDVAKAIEGLGDNSAELDAVARIINDNLTNTKYTFSAGSTANTYTATVPNDGYYFIKDTTTTLPNGDTRSKHMLSVVKDVTINAKDTSMKPDKEITGGETNVKAGTAAMGDTVTFQVAIPVPDTTTFKQDFWFVMDDTLPVGLTFMGISEVATYASTSIDTENNYKLVSGATPTATLTTPPADADSVGYTLTVAAAGSDSYGAYTAPADAAAAVTAAGGQKIKVTFNEFKQFAETEVSGKNHIGEFVVITYTAVVNDDAVYGSTGNKNEVEFTYSNDPNNDYNGDNPDETTPTGKTPKDETIEYVAGLEILKVDGKNNNPLANAEFEISSDDYNKTITKGIKYEKAPYTVEDGETVESGDYWKLKDGSFTNTDPTTPNMNTTQYDNPNEKYVKVTWNKIVVTPGESKKITVITGADGIIDVKGLKPGTYTIKETHAPDGYNKIDTVFTLVIDWGEVTDDNGTKSYEFKIGDGTSKEGNQYLFTLINDGTSEKAIYKVQIENNQGTELPSTGGIGTTIFYAVGGCMVLAALVLLITKKRMSREG